MGIGVRHFLHTRSVAVAVAGVLARMAELPDTSGGSGAAGPNLEDNQEYCYLWPHEHSSHRRPHDALRCGLRQCSGAPVRSCTCSRVTPGASSTTFRPSGVMSSTHRSV